ncbi:hypothetical protein IV203_038071 [Nitzschia inconspicua]|uniref:Uncharacterized protein n=1 Tax=Nitzschia inconspicua TaxID=303405 RepID=A0A9K3LM49_9STRA|nr:hypothetical protein IV203_038071 [Nitzschia inconspicua]
MLAAAREAPIAAMVTSGAISNSNGFVCFLFLVVYKFVRDLEAAANCGAVPLPPLLRCSGLFLLQPFCSVALSLSTSTVVKLGTNGGDKESFHYRGCLLELGTGTGAGALAAGAGAIWALAGAIAGAFSRSAGAALAAGGAGG